jgi:hypothetical protein
VTNMERGRMTTTSDLALAADAGFLECHAAPGAFIAETCREACSLLREALEGGDIDRIAAIRLQAEAVRAYSAQNRQLPEGALLAATELARRAERCLGVAIRRGQEAGAIRGRHQGRVAGIGLPSPTDFARLTELSPGGGQPGIYALTDGITDEAFEAAIKEAQAEGNLSRASVARKAAAHAAGAPLAADWIPGSADRYGEGPAQRRRLIAKWAAEGHSSRQMAGLLGMGDEGVRRIARAEGIDIPADEVTARSVHLDSNRIVRETVHSLEGLVMGIGLADVASLDPAETAEWAASLATSIRALSRFTRKLKETTHGRA